MKNTDLLFSIVKELCENELIYRHGRRVAKLACAIAQKMKYCNKGVKQVYFTAIVHDLGKIQLPKEVINKPGAFDDNERMIVRKHPKLGYSLLKDVKSGLIIAEAVLQHHERLDGSGYPFGLQAKDIHPVSRIIAVADVIDAMASEQVYRPALSIDKALEEIQEKSGLLYDPEIVAVSLSLIGKEEFCV